MFMAQLQASVTAGETAGAATGNWGRSAKGDVV